MGSTGMETRQQKRARGVGLQGPTGTWGAGQGRQDSKCRTVSVGRRDGSLFGQVIQDRNEGVHLGGKSGAAPSRGGGW